MAIHMKSHKYEISSVITIHGLDHDSLISQFRDSPEPIKNLNPENLKITLPVITKRFNEDEGEIGIIEN